VGDPVAHPWADPVSEAIAALELDRMTPREALDTLYRLQSLRKVSGKDT
jgi:hypothetical protein